MKTMSSTYYRRVQLILIKMAPVVQLQQKSSSILEEIPLEMFVERLLVSYSTVEYYANRQLGDIYLSFIVSPHSKCSKVPDSRGQ